MNFFHENLCKINYFLKKILLNMFDYIDGIIDFILIVLIVFAGVIGFSIAFIGSLPILLVIGLIYLIKIWIDEISNHR